MFAKLFHCRAVLGSKQKKVQIFLMYFPLPLIIAPSFSIINIPPPTKNVHLSSTVEHRLTLNHRKSVIYTRIHSQCYTFCGFEQMYNDTYSPF